MKNNSDKLLLFSIKTVVFSLVILVFLLLISESAQARNTAIFADCQTTITVNIAFFGEGASEGLVKSWEQGAEAIFNGSSGNQTYGECQCKLVFNIVVTTIANAEACPDDFHCIQIDRVPRGAETISNVWGGGRDLTWQTSGETKVSSSAEGLWNNTDGVKVAAHEIGHLLGLSDEYAFDGNGGHINLNPQPEGSPQSLMAQAWGDATLLPEHLDKILEASGIGDCPSECCRCGNGRIDAGEECDPGNAEKGIPAIPCECLIRTKCIDCKCVEPSIAEILN